MIMMDLQEVLRVILGSYRVQFIALERGCSSPEASALDFLFRDRLYEDFNYSAFAAEIMDLVPEDNVIDYKDGFGLHYIVFQGRGAEKAFYNFCGPYTYRAYDEADFSRLIEAHGLQGEAIDAVRWYFKRIPVIEDYLGWRQMLSAFLSRYTANPDLEFIRVTHDHPEVPRKKPSIGLSAISYASIEARYGVEAAMLAAIRRGDIAEATYQQNQFMGFTLDQRLPDRLRDAKDMLIVVNTLCRKAIELAAVHPMYIDDISGQFTVEIENAQTVEQVEALVPKMIRHYCLAVRRHSLERYSATVRDCLNYVDFHYMETLSLESLATRFAVNKNYLSNRFHKEVGRTLTDYINQTRVQRAVRLLERTPLSMQEIAEQCGFTDANYFTRTFKKINGLSPNEYRKSLGKRAQSHS